MAELPQDISERISRDFGEKEVEALGLLKTFLDEKWVWREDRIRFCRCAVHVAHGSLEKLKEALAQAHKDYRDLIVESEYDIVQGKLVQVRNFTEPFG